MVCMGENIAIAAATEDMKHFRMVSIEGGFASPFEKGCSGRTAAV